MARLEQDVILAVIDSLVDPVINSHDGVSCAAPASGPGQSILIRDRWPENEPLPEWKIFEEQ